MTRGNGVAIQNDLFLKGNQNTYWLADVFPFIDRTA